MSVEVGGRKTFKTNTILFSDGEERLELFWAYRAPVLFRSVTDIGRECKEYAFVQYGENTDGLDAVDVEAICTCLDG